MQVTVHTKREHRSVLRIFIFGQSQLMKLRNRKIIHFYGYPKSSNTLKSSISWDIHFERPKNINLLPLNLVLTVFFATFKITRYPNII